MPIYPRKRFGQHWLRDEGVLAAIVVAAALANTDRVLEIGPGTGNLTAKILPLVGQLTAVELDRDLCQHLRRRFSAPHFHLIEGDILQLAIPQDINKVVANIPYNITGEILELLLGTISQPVLQFQTIVLLVQREIAQRLTSLPGTSSYGALTVRCQYLADCQWVKDVPPHCFNPPPKVHSAVIKLTPRPLPFLPQSPPWLETILRVGFAQKRKMLRNNLQSLIDRVHLIDIFTELGIPDTARAENLSLEQWVKLADATIGWRAR
ncbi:MAG: 16S rRNA (adenine(1518)-N(6)/adenine(1519)-N(6))-dimethyltransferase RsmA [Pseudanabaenaceae cyanobacterium SKYGB_i_bin29]|nr:16S rRNA (adenine(1518)-N(6)/adenine(1519)-N(6))-dimethyltransferase RsmA [Pseudanabaenaceae cyanobacterium SKYG29]MDW8421869.1 16S rRNA (adenine(1518)-N(6)/adenine(1519)-N(6))-dimethyltransferase RsmA [Pseudanabaenaceae cyanobacterium SKYGB_i_bin29]